MHVNFKAQEPDTNLMATLWQPYGNLMIWLGKILRCEDIKSIFNIRDINFAETKNNAYLCNRLSLTFSKVVPLVREYKRFVARHQTKQCLPLHFFPRRIG